MIRDFVFYMFSKLLFNSADDSFLEDLDIVRYDF